MLSSDLDSTEDTEASALNDAEEEEQETDSPAESNVDEVGGTVFTHRFACTIS